MIPRSTGGGLSADGRFLVTNDKNDYRVLRKFRINEDRVPALGEESVHRVGFKVERWNTNVAISPSGLSALASTLESPVHVWVGNGIGSNREL